VHVRDIGLVCARQRCSTCPGAHDRGARLPHAHSIHPLTSGYIKRCSEKKKVATFLDLLYCLFSGLCGPCLYKDDSNLYSNV